MGTVLTAPAGPGRPEGTPEAIHVFLHRDEGSAGAAGIGFVVRMGREVATIELRTGDTRPEHLHALVPGVAVGDLADEGDITDVMVPVGHAELDAAQRAALVAALPLLHILGEVNAASVHEGTGGSAS